MSAQSMFAAELALRHAEQALRAAIKEQFPIGTRVRIAYGGASPRQGYLEGTVAGHDDGTRGARYVLIRKGTPITPVRAARGLKVTVWHHYSKLVILPHKPQPEAVTL